MDFRDVHISRNQISVAILAGGKSSRFGTNKAAAVIPGSNVTLLEKAIATASHICGEIMVVGQNPDLHAGLAVRFVADFFPGFGPVGGVVTALHTATTEYLVIMACDQPLLRADDVRRLVDGLGPHVACAFRAPDGDIEPLPVALKVEDARRQLTQRSELLERKLGRFLKSLDPMLVDGGDSRVRLRDIDTVADLDEIARQDDPGAVN